ncbi:MAG: hypothetical protein DRR08_00705 [Candidatus Parabeggiatoa sp. nov. 2]|nr:MAG: hypothetical protein B6247_05140 [Beggiatoa sp. 4572_84]RKZ64445.1 MAG: hypothetical protein DRR08_00705 [Gammaproteobacteria bacterium]
MAGLQSLLPFFRAKTFASILVWQESKLTFGNALKSVQTLVWQVWQCQRVNGRAKLKLADD